MSEPVLTAENILIHYPGSAFKLIVNEFTLEKAGTSALVGPSGCGKTSFVEVLAGVRLPASGEVRIKGISIGSQSDAVRRKVRRETLGFVFQRFELLPYLNVLDNVLLPVRFDREPHKDDTDYARHLLEQLGLTDTENRKPTTLSQGEQQRIAIARSMIRRPQLIIADEPTGNLDTETSTYVMKLLSELVHQHKTALLVVTHDHSILSHFDTVIDCLEFFK